MFEAYKKALDDNVPVIEPGSETHLHAMNNLGLAYYMYGEDDKAIHYYTKAIKLKEDFWEAWWNCSTAVLRKASSGEVDLFPKGWEMYKARFLKGTPVKLKNKKEDLVYWDTISSGESIVILTEQGIGDNIMWGRYADALRSKFDEVYIQCDESLEPLFSDFKCVRDASDCGATLAYPLCSLAECFNGGVPIAGDWLRERFTPMSFPSDRPNIGIVWSGNPGHVNDHNRSTSIGRFSRFAKDYNLYGLQPGFTGNKYVRALDVSSWEKTGSAIAGLDLVIGVDTSVMHLVGSMGCEGWLLQPYRETDFRWGNGVRRSLWYDSIEVYENPQLS